MPLSRFEKAIIRRPPNSRWMRLRSIVRYFTKKHRCRSTSLRSRVGLLAMWEPSAGRAGGSQGSEEKALGLLFASRPCD